MCQHKVLAHNKNGYIIQCNTCNHFQIGFGTALICYSVNHFEQFIESVEMQHQLFSNDATPHRKNITLPTFSKNVQLIVNYHELENVLDLIEEAMVSIELDEMLVQ